MRRSSNSFLSQFPFGLLPLTFEAMGIRPTRHETGRAASHHRLAVTPNPRRDSGLGHISAEQELVAFSSLLQCIRCARCKARLKIDWRALIRETKKMLNELGMVFFSFFVPCLVACGRLSKLTHPGCIHPCLRCSRCRAWSCIGGDTYKRHGIREMNHVATGENFKVTWCCGDGRLFIVFLLLCGIEDAISATAPRAESKPKPPPKSQTSSAATLLGQLSPRSSRLPKGTGYGPQIYTLSEQEEPSTEVKHAHAADLKVYFSALACALSGMSRKSGNFFGRPPHPVVSAMVRRSPMLHHAVELFRGTSIHEVWTWREAIAAAVDFLEALASHPNTRSVILDERVLFPPEEQLLPLVRSETRNLYTSVSRMDEHETAQSLYVILQQQAVAYRKFMDVASRVSDVAAEEGSVAVMEKVCDFVDRLGALTQEGHRAASLRTTAATLAPEATLKKNKTPQDVEKEASEWHRAHCLKEVPDEDMFAASSFASNARALQDGAQQPGRMRALLTQIASLSTDLPEGIYIRHGEQRPDVLKALIIGPAGTPYEHGLFEFDIYCGKAFPNSPPRVLFRTTANGTAHFNPNLYPDGKSASFPPERQPFLHSCPLTSATVCLSLLGTWDGQPWEPDRSTLLQLLVSIQCMLPSQPTSDP